MRSCCSISVLPEDGFATGTVLADRFRIVGRLGRGGMGDVYRADDLKLGQSVALKFLPAEMSRDPDRMRRFLAEVRIARQISHANVCRVYDVLEEDGHHFLSMEYIDGEDLASLLRRIGKLPQDKAIELTRQICAGLSAAHDRGVLHRDLKPANVMIDGRGIARIADFGLAGAEDEIRGAEVRAGTPGYMAPEQLRGDEVTVRSDLYALGLVLYEMFTGKRGLQGRSLDALLREQTSLPSRTSEDLVDLDPAVERVIRRCLQLDPARRPASALAVAAALPGGDPVAAALAAGELPSPEMIASLGDQTRMRFGWALTCLLVTIAGVFASALISDRTRLVTLSKLDKPPAVLEERAREVIATLAPDADARDHTQGAQRDIGYLRWIQSHDSTATRWDSLASGPPFAFEFWYRESPSWLLPMNHLGQVHPGDPPMRQPGMILVGLTPEGRLSSWLSVPPDVSEPDTTARETDWTKVFELAGLDISEFTEVDPIWTPQVFADSRRAWSGRFPARDIDLRIEAASYRGQPVSFQFVEPWQEPENKQGPRGSWATRVAQAAVTLLTIAMLGGSILVARRNLKLGRGDRKGSLRLALYSFVMFFFRFVLDAHHIPSISSEWNLLIFCSGLGLFIAVFTFLMYAALEPYARQYWPELLISWSRALHGRIRDARVGRDLLIGVAVGIVIRMIRPVYFLVQRALGHAPDMPETIALAGLGSTAGAVGNILERLVNCLWIPMALVLLLLFVKWIVKSTRWAVIVAYALCVIIISSGSPWIEWIGIAVTLATLFVLLLRFGLVAIIGYFWIDALIGGYPLTTDLSIWYASTGAFAALLAIATAAYAFRLATRSPVSELD
ncbi:MAG: serine/threonine-protein kinase [Candidatus Eisenbacteria bacterium]